MINSAKYGIINTLANAKFIKYIKEDNMMVGRFNRIRIDRQNVKMTHNKTIVSLETKDGTSFEVRQVGPMLQIITEPEKVPVCVLDNNSKKIIESWMHSFIPESKQASEMYNLMQIWINDGNYFYGQKIYPIQFEDGPAHSCDEWEELCDDYAPHKCSRMITLPEYCFAAILGGIKKNPEGALGVTLNVNPEELEQEEKYCLVDFKENLNGNIFPFKYNSKINSRSWVVLED